MIFIARELREIMARLGIRSVAELVGRIDLVRQKSQDDNFKLSRVDPLNAFCSVHTSTPL